MTKRRTNNSPGDRARGGHDADVPSLPVQMVEVVHLVPSPFQPAGRPSPSALAEIYQVVELAGSLDQLMGEGHVDHFENLREEARELAALAWDIRNHGVRVPLEARRDDEGRLELLSGHRRLSASKLAGLTDVPVIDRGAMSDAQAQAELLRANLHRTGFKTLQQARLLQSLEALRASAGSQDTVRSLAEVAGVSYGHACELLKIAAAITPELVALVGGEERLVGVGFRALRRIAAEGDPQHRLELARRAAGTSPKLNREPAQCSAVEYTTRRGGGFSLQCNAPIEVMAREDLETLDATLSSHLTRVRARLSAAA